MKERWLITLGCLLATLTGLYNVGIIALDDYSNGFSIMVPAQNLPSFSPMDGVHPYLPKMLLRAITRAFFWLGASEPLTQLRLAFGLIGFCSFFAQVFLVRSLFPADPPGRIGPRSIGLFLMGFYFLMPRFQSRPMIESLAMPFLSVSAAFAARFQATVLARSAEPSKWLFASLCAVALASVLRFQSGVCALALVWFVLKSRSWNLAAVFAASALFLAVVTGLPDLYWRGDFHGQLRAYLTYNLSAAGDHYGVMPFYTFGALAIGLSLPPTFFARYLGFPWKKAYSGLTAPLLYLLIFTITHSLSPHKEDRFFVPVLPLFLVCLVPLAHWLWHRGPAWRRNWFLGLNGVLLGFTCVSIPQNNVVSLATWLAKHPSIGKVDSLAGALVFAPQAFLSRPIAWNRLPLEGYSVRECDRITLVRWDTPLPAEWHRAYKPIARFSPSGLEAILVRLNHRNARRGTLEAFIPVECSLP